MMPLWKSRSKLSPSLSGGQVIFPQLAEKCAMPCASGANSIVGIE
jgi:hypothetical protein